VWGCEFPVPPISHNKQNKPFPVWDVQLARKANAVLLFPTPPGERAEVCAVSSFDDNVKSAHWRVFLNARLFVSGWMEDGMSDDEMLSMLSVDPVQLQLLKMTAKERDDGNG
jgi:hypothetical protein